MIQDGTVRSGEMANDSAADAVVAAMRFLRTLRYRKAYLASALAVAALLGLFYYLTATRIYKATASLLVTHTGSEMWNTSMSAGGSRDALIPTYERLFSSAAVLDGAIERLLAMPAAARIDLVDAPRDRWRDTLRDNLSAGAHRRTNIIELSYRSKSPDAAQAVVSAVVESYLHFMETSHKDVSENVAEILHNELSEKERELNEKQKNLLHLQAASGALGLPENGTLVHPVVQRAIQINENLIDVRRQRLELEASLAAVRAAAFASIC